MDEILKDAEQALHEALIPEGFKRKRRTWYLDADESVCVIHADKSPYGPLLVPYLGVLFRRFSSELRPKVNKCSWYGKLVCTDVTGLEFVPILDADKIRVGIAKGVPREVRGHSLGVLECTSVQQFVEPVIRVGVPFLRGIAVLEGFKRANREGRFKHFPASPTLV